MMRKTETKKGETYTIDLMKIDGDGAFPCPKCNTMISPDDETEEVYKIVETRVEKDELRELTLECNQCGSKIRLTGFLSPSEKAKLK